MPTIVRKIDRPEKRLVTAFSGIGAATIHECVGKETGNAMDAGIKPIGPGMKVSGPAITVECFPNDNSTLHIAMTMCQPGDVLVVDAHGVESGMLGSQMAFQCVHRGIGGLIIDGGVRDIEELREMGFACFSRHVSPQGTAKNTLGSINVPVQCGGVIVNPGDVVVADDDGVVIVPRQMAREVLQKSRARDEKEKADRELYNKGKTSAELLGLQRLLDGKNVVIRERGTKQA